MAQPDLAPIWAMLDAHVAAGRYPGYVSAVRVRGVTDVHAAGRTAIEADSSPMRRDTLFRIASITKPMGASLALGLVEDGVLGLDDPIGRWLPEMAKPRVLVAPDAPLDQTTEAARAITVRDLLRLTSGWGAVLEATPLQHTMMERGVFPGPLPSTMSGDEFIATLAGIPLAFQPGDGWLYDTGMDILGVLLARAAGRPMPELFAARITEPLEMTSTSFWAPDGDHLAAAYEPKEGRLELIDPPHGAYARPPGFASLSGGLVATAEDVLRFYVAMADGGTPILSAGSLASMTADALTDAQRAHALPIVDAGGSWGLGTAVDIEAVEPWMAPGRWGWTGGTGTTAYVDPTRDTVSVLLTQRAMAGPLDSFGDFWTAVAEAA